MRSRPALLCLALLLFLLLTPACNGSSGAGSHQTAGSATLNVRLTDAPIDMSNVQSVNVTLTGVTVYPEDSGTVLQVADPGTEMAGDAGAVPISLTTYPATFDLLTLTGGATALLASGEIPAGSYSRIRLEISDATLVYLDGTSVSLKIDSHKVDVPIRFEAAAGTDLSVTLDFDAAASVQVNETASDTFILRPVVTPVPSN